MNEDIVYFEDISDMTGYIQTLGTFFDIHDFGKDEKTNKFYVSYAPWVYSDCISKEKNNKY